MSRLTSLDFMSGYFPQENVIDTECFDKLGQLEDLMEEYGLHSIDNLELALSLWKWTSTYNSNRVIGKLIEENTELKKKMENAIVLPEIKKGQKIYCLRGYKLNHLRTGYFQKWNNEVWADVIFDPKEVTDEDGYTDVDFDFEMVDINAVFITKKEAEQRLKELKGE